MVCYSGSAVIFSGDVFVCAVNIHYFAEIYAVEVVAGIALVDNLLVKKVVFFQIVFINHAAFEDQFRLFEAGG